LRDEHRRRHRIDLASLQLGQVDLAAAIDGGLVWANAQIKRRIDVTVEDQDAVVQGAGDLAAAAA
jgi:hypothetical protein